MASEKENRHVIWQFYKEMLATLDIISGDDFNIFAKMKSLAICCDDASSSSLKTICNAAKQIERLVVYGIRGVETLSSDIFDNRRFSSSLQYITINQCKLIDLPEKENFRSCLLSCIGLREVRLLVCHLNNAALLVLCEDTRPYSLYVFDCMFKDCKQALYLIQKCSNLKGFGMSLVHVSEINKYDAVMPALIKHGSNLDCIRLNNFQLPDEVFVNLVEQRGAQLARLGLNCYGFTNAHLRSMLPHLSRITHLEFSNNGPFNNQGLMMIAEGCRSLVHLNVSDCQGFDEEGMLAFLKTCRSLRNLNLSECFRKRIDSQMVAKWAREMPCIEELYLAYQATLNNEAFSALLHFCRKLMKLDVSSAVLLTEAALTCKEYPVRCHLERLCYIGCSGLYRTSEERMRELLPSVPQLARYADKEQGMPYFVSFHAKRFLSEMY